LHPPLKKVRWFSYLVDRQRAHFPADRRPAHSLQRQKFRFRQDLPLAGCLVDRQRARFRVDQQLVHFLTRLP
jgi:hypothetical protein